VSLFEHVPAPRIEERKASGPTRVADQLPTTSVAARFNSWLAVKITKGVGTMWCAYASAALALIGLPDAIRVGRPAIISWIAQTFLQLVLLSIIIVGQNIQSAASDKRAADTYNDAEAACSTVRIGAPCYRRGEFDVGAVILDAVQQRRASAGFGKRRADVLVQPRRISVSEQVSPAPRCEDTDAPTFHGVRVHALILIRGMTGRR